jgi:hypothetical protein
MNNEEIMIKILERGYPFYNEGAQVQMLINRAVGNTNKGSKRWVNKLVSFNKEDFTINCFKLIAQMKHIGDPSIRLYGSINARKYIEARKSFSHRLIDKYDDDLFWKDINSNLISAFMQPENSIKKYYLIDSDDKNNFDAISNLIPDDKLKKVYNTKKGHHFITSGFDIRPLKDIPNVEMHRDGLMILWVLEDI